MKKRLMMVCLLLALCVAAVCHAETHVHSGGTATCEALAVCDICHKPYGHLADHDWGAWVADDNKTHTRTCRTNSEHTQTRFHTGGAATCTESAKCALCGAVHDDPLGHAPEFYAGYPATCISEGRTDGKICGRCGTEVTPRSVIPAKGHSYNTWTPTGDGTHNAVCTAPGCESADAVLCTLWEVTAADAVQSLCPVCGSFGDQTIPVLLAQPSTALPYGQLLVRGMAQPFPGVLYAFTVTGSYAGEVLALSGTADMTLQDDFGALPPFRLVRVDVTPATEATARAEVWTEVEYRLVSGNLLLSTDVCGLFLLLPVE